MTNLQNQVETTKEGFKEGSIYYGVYDYNGCSHSFYQIIKFLSPTKVVVRKVIPHLYKEHFDNNPTEITYKIKVNKGETLPSLPSLNEFTGYIRNNKIKINNYLYLKPSRSVRDGDIFTDCDYR